MSIAAIGKGLVAGLVATIVLSVMMLMKQSMGMMPELDPISMLSQMAGFGSPALGWVGHFVIGTIFWGAGFAVVNGYLGGPQWLRGVIFGTGAWLMMMIVVMPMAGLGLFGLGLGVMAAVITLVMHLAYGLVLGGVYGLLEGGPSPSHGHVHK